MTETDENISISRNNAVNLFKSSQQGKDTVNGEQFNN